MYGQAGREEIVDGGYIHVTDTFHITLHLRDDSFSTCSLIILRGSLLYLILLAPIVFVTSYNGIE